MNWDRVKKEIYNINIKKFHQIKVKKMMEDWFLSDLKGLCKYLKIKEVVNLKGYTGYEKIQSLFKKGNMVYQKGTSVKNFIQFLDIGIIRDKHISELKNLESVLNVKLNKK